MELGRLDTAWGVDGDAELLLDDPQDSLGGVLDDASGWPADVLAFARRGSEIDQIRKDAQSQSDRGRLRTPPKSPDDWEVYDNQLRGARATPRGPPPPPPPPPDPGARAADPQNRTLPILLQEPTLVGRHLIKRMDAGRRGSTLARTP